LTHVDALIVPGTGRTTVETSLRVRYAETDAQGVVYYANYLVWFEVGRVNYLRALGYDYQAMTERALGFVIAEATCRYLAPAYFDDEVTVQTWVEAVHRSSFRLGYAVLNRQTGVRLAEGSTVQVFVSMNGQPRPQEIPPDIRATLLAAADGS
jgi:acyl-CoA thioester hydrolase